MSKSVTILGAGLVGSLLAIYLAKRGYKVEVYERRGDMRKEKIIQPIFNDIFDHKMTAVFSEENRE